MKPKEVNVLGKVYTIEYCDNPANVDKNKRKSLWGQVDYWTRSIRIYDNKTTLEDIWDTIIHEIIHVIATELELKKLTKDDDDSEHTVGLLAIGLVDVLFRNDFIKLKTKWVTAKDGKSRETH